jgi:DNA gyrase subunit A
VLQDSEKVMLLIDTTSFNSYHNLITVSRNGFIKKTAIKEYVSRTKKGVAAAKLEEKDSLVGVYLSMNDEDKMFVASSSGNYNFYTLDNVSQTGRATKGVKAIKLGTNEYVLGATIIKKGIEYKGILTILESGKGKITKVEDFSTTTRAIKGQQVMSLKDDNLAAIYAVPESQEKIFISANNKAVLLDVNSIPVQNRVTTGVKIIDVKNLKGVIEIM